MVSPCRIRYLMRGETRRLHKLEVAVGRRRNPGCRGGVGFGEVVEIGGVVTEVVGLVHGYFARLVGLEVVGTGDAKNAGEVCRAVHVPALVAAGLLEELLPAAAQAAECLPVISWCRSRRVP